MTLPPVLLAPVRELSPAQRRSFDRAINTALVFILGWLAYVRFVRPQWPVADPDTWGYLFPGISRLLGGPFQHTQGRNFIYPGWIYLLLHTTGDFRAIAIAQRFLGLATCAGVWLVWRQWRAWFATTRLPLWADVSFGLGTVIFFGRASSVIHYEVQLRPEAIFPFCAVLDLWLLLAFVRAWYAERRPVKAAVLAAFSVFATAFAYQLKPSFGLGAGFAMLPIVVPFITLQGPERWQSRVWLVGALAAGGLASFVLLVLPERALAQSDPQASLFLPHTLLTVHARPIRDQLNEDVRNGTPTPFAAPWLASAAGLFDEGLRRASEHSQRPYHTLGYNPDALLYPPGAFCQWLDAQLPPAQVSAFCFYYYRRAWTHHPGSMLAKICRQLGVFYSLHCPAFRSSTKLRPAQYYNDKALLFLTALTHAQSLGGYAPAQRYIDAVRVLSTSSVTFRTPVWLVVADVIASVVYLLLLVAFTVAMAGFVFFRQDDDRRALWKPGLVLALIHGICFGNCLTVAVVHSLEVHRYALNLLVYAALGEAATAAWLCEFVLAWRAHQAVGDQDNHIKN